MGDCKSGVFSRLRINSATNQIAYLTLHGAALPNIGLEFSTHLLKKLNLNADENSLLNSSQVKAGHIGLNF